MTGCDVGRIVNSGFNDVDPWAFTDCTWGIESIGGVLSTVGITRNSARVSNITFTRCTFTGTESVMAQPALSGYAFAATTTTATAEFLSFVDCTFDPRFQYTAMVNRNGTLKTTRCTMAGTAAGVHILHGGGAYGAAWASTDDNFDACAAAFLVGSYNIAGDQLTTITINSSIWDPAWGDLSGTLNNRIVWVINLTSGAIGPARSIRL